MTLLLLTLLLPVSVSPLAWLLCVAAIAWSVR